ncbi:MAG: hypothetical protein ABW190_04815 [Rhizobacter sp.]
MTKRKTNSTHGGDKKAAPWDKDNPKPDGEHKHLSPKAKASAKRHAKAAGRPYPNLVDNMAAARKK